MLEVERSYWADQETGTRLYDTLAEAYAALPSTGGRIRLTADLWINSAQTLSLTAGKPLLLDLCGRKISLAHSSGIGIHVTQVQSGDRYSFSIENGVIAYAGSAASVTGMQIDTAANVSIRNVAFNDFNTGGALALRLNGVEEGDFSELSFAANTLALQLDVASNQNRFSSCWFQANTTAIVVTDACGNSFEDCLFQANTAQKPVQIVASAADVHGVRFINCWFEDNGDGTSSTRQISFQPASGRAIKNTIIDNNFFGGGANTPASSYFFEAAGLGAVKTTSFRNNSYWQSSNYTTGAVWSIVAGSALDDEVIASATSTTASAGTNGAVPAQVAGYITITISGVAYKIPYFNS